MGTSVGSSVMPTPSPTLTIGIQHHGNGVVTVAAHLEGADVVMRRFQGIAANAEDVSPAFPEVQRAFFNVVRRAFETEGGSTASGPWRSLAERTTRERRAQGYDPFHPILQRTQTLMRSLTLPGADAVMIGAPKMLALGSGVDYFKYHQSNRPRTKIPRRAPVDVTQADKHELLRPIVNHITGRSASSRLPGRGRGGRSR